MIAVTDRFLGKGLLGPMVDPSDDSYHGISDSRSWVFWLACRSHCPSRIHLILYGFWSDVCSDLVRWAG